MNDILELLKSSEWPVAVNPSLICHEDSDQEKYDRANGIIGLILDQAVRGKKFLDFGCGEGHVCQTVARQGASIAIGYDITSKGWEDKKECTLTTVFDKVVEQGPYDIVLMYDVIDHIVDKDPSLVLGKIKTVLAPNGKIYMRCHPWISRHGGHYYQSYNKAFVHAILSDEEFKQLGYTSNVETRRVIAPIRTYDSWVAAAKLRTISRFVDRQAVEPFFERPSIRERLPQIDGKFPKFQMEQSFHDYVLTA